ncbi:MAG: TetR/AcrR family transcriptional regulator [Chloroflexota bacterium]
MAIKEKVDPRMRRTRKLLQAALFDLLKKKPLAKIQIKEIAEAAELSRPTFYKQFETKEELLFSHVDDVLEQISKEVFLEAQNGRQIDMVILVTASFRQWQKHKQLLRWVFQVENKDLVIKALHSQLRGIKQVFDHFVPPLELAQEYEDYLTGFISGGMYMLIKTWLANDMRESPEKMASLTFMLLYNGFSPLRAMQSNNPELLDNAIELLSSTG